MNNDLWKLTAVEAVALLKKREISPLELVEASAKRIAEVEPAVNALPTLCLDRARAHARRIMVGQACEAEGEAGWLAGLPVSIKDLTDVAGVRTTYGSPLFANHVPANRIPSSSASSARAASWWRSPTRRSSAPAAAPSTRASAAPAIPGTPRSPVAGPRAAARSSLATGEVWLAQGTDHGGSLRRPGTYCTVVGLRPSPGPGDARPRETISICRSRSRARWRGPFRPGAVPRSMAGLVLEDPLTFDVPRAPSPMPWRGRPRPRRMAFTADSNGQLPIDRESREICTKAARRLRGAGLHRRGIPPDIGASTRPSLSSAVRPSSSTASSSSNEHRDKLKPDIVWNTERGLNATPSALAWADRERAALFRRMAAIFGNHFPPATPGAPTARLRRRPAPPRDHRRQEAGELHGGFDDERRASP